MDFNKRKRDFAGNTAEVDFVLFRSFSLIRRRGPFSKAAAAAVAAAAVAVH